MSEVSAVSTGRSDAARDASSRSPRSPASPALPGSDTRSSGPGCSRSRSDTRSSPCSASSRPCSPALPSAAWCRAAVSPAAARPALWYAALELAIGLWALALIPLVAAGRRSRSGAGAGRRRSRAAMAGRLRASVRAAAAGDAGDGRDHAGALEAVLAPRLAAGGAVGRVYAANTAGAVAGTLATTFLIIPALGLSATLALCACLNLVCAAAMWLLRPTACPSDLRRSVSRIRPACLRRCSSPGFSASATRS